MGPVLGLLNPLCSWLWVMLMVTLPLVVDLKRPILCYVDCTTVEKTKEASYVLFSLPQAWEVNKGTNCVTSYLADCETQLCKVPRQGLLYGVPVSLKECFSYKVCPAPVPANQLWVLGHPQRKS